MHVEANEGVLNEHLLFFTRRILNPNFGMYGCLLGRTSRKKHKKCKVRYLGLPLEEKELGTIYYLFFSSVHCYIMAFNLN